MRMHVQLEEMKCQNVLLECTVMHDEKVDVTCRSAASFRRRMDPYRDEFWTKSGISPK